MLLTAFALREAAGAWSDTRPALSRAAAHLAFASALRGSSEASLDGQVAGLLLLVLCGRQQAALDAMPSLEAMAPGNAPLRTWLTVAALRAKSDWRQPIGTTLLERIELFRAKCSRLGGGAVFEEQRQFEPEDLPDWWRTILDYGIGPVWVGHSVLSRTLAMELSEASETWRFLHAEDPPADPAAPFAGRPGRCVARDEDGEPRVAVIDEGAWSAFHQRHLLQAIELNEWFLRDALALEDDARGFARQMDTRFWSLDLHPVFERMHATDPKSYQTAMAKAVRLAAETPELVPPGLWTPLWDKPDFAPRPATLPDARFWMAPLFPPGTAQAPRPRTRWRQTRPSREDWDALRRLAPYEGCIIGPAVQLKRPDRSVANLMALYEPIVDIDVGALMEIAYLVQGDFEGSKQIRTKLCDMRPNECLALGALLAEQGLEDEAAVAYQRAVDKASDRVAVAQDAGWLVKYYQEHGRKQKALKIAREAAESYASGGLLTLAELLEDTGESSEAERYYLALFQRYEHKGPLAGFYARRVVKGDAAARRKLNRFVQETFPAGMERWKARGAPGPPREGVRVDSANAASSNAGLGVGDVVVALDGWRVRTVEQYDLVRAFTSAEHMVLVVWKGSGYETVEAAPKDRRFGISMSTFAVK
jgi:tetratricopeptide (TPR) repeat protein